MPRRLWILPVTLLGGSLCACSSGFGPRTVTSADPSSKIPAIKASVEENDLSVVRQLVKDLDSDDPAVRFYAIGGLQRLTNENFGYQYFVDEDQRKAAVDKWKAWLEGWEAGQKHAAGR